MVETSMRFRSADDRASSAGQHSAKLFPDDTRWLGETAASLATAAALSEQGHLARQGHRAEETL